MLIKIQCPQCNERHELPDTFAGGVYRCGRCGTLMSVSADAPRTEASDAPKPRSAAPAAETEEDSWGNWSGTSSGSRSRGSRSHSGSRSSSRSSSRSLGSRSTSGSRSMGGPREAKGKKPTAVNKLRWLLIVCGASCVALLAVLVLVLVNAGKTPPPRPMPKKPVATAPTPAPVPTAPAEPPKLRFDPAKAPLDVTGANIAGIPLGAPTHVILDGRMTGPPRQQFEALLRETLSRSPGPKTLQLTWAGNKPVTLSATSAADLGAAKLKEWFAGNLATTTPSLEQAADEGAADTAEVVLVLAGPMSRSSAESLLNRLSRAGRSPVLHLVLLDAEAPMILRQQAESNHGACVDLGSARLASWSGSLALEPEPLPPPRWKAQASSTHTGWPPENAIDGKADTLWHSEWVPQVPPGPRWIELDFGRPQEIRTLTLWTANIQGYNGASKRLLVEVGDDGVQWTKAGEFDAWSSLADRAHPVDIRLDAPVTARRLRLTSLQGVDEKLVFNLTEIKVNGAGSP